MARIAKVIAPGYPHHVVQRGKSGATRLKPEDWKSGENLWLIDLCAPFGGGEFILKEIREKVFKGQKVKTLQPAPDGSGMECMVVSG